MTTRSDLWIRRTFSPSEVIRNTVSLVHPALRAIDPRLRRAVWNRIFCSKEYRFVYFRIPKAANSTVSLSLAACVNERSRLVADCLAKGREPSS